MDTPPPSDAPIFASPRRRLLAVYLDSLLFGACWAIFQHFVRVPFSAVVQWIVFAALELALYASLASPSLRVLGIHRVADPHALGERTRTRLVVDARIKRRENWVTFLVGVAAITEGTKSAARWTTWNPPAPFFGHPTSLTSNAMFAIGTGVVEIAIATLLFRMRRIGWWLALLGSLVSLASTVVSWNLWDGYVAEMMTRRGAFPGLPVLPGEVETLRSVTPEILVAATLIVVIALLAARRRYGR